MAGLHGLLRLLHDRVEVNRPFSRQASDDGSLGLGLPAWILLWLHGRELHPSLLFLRWRRWRDLLCLQWRLLLRLRGRGRPRLLLHHRHRHRHILWPLLDDGHPRCRPCCQLPLVHRLSRVPPLHRAQLHGLRVLRQLGSLRHPVRRLVEHDDKLERLDQSPPPGGEKRERKVLRPPPLRELRAPPLHVDVPEVVRENDQDLGAAQEAEDAHERAQLSRPASIRAGRRISCGHVHQHAQDRQPAGRGQEGRQAQQSRSVEVLREAGIQQRPDLLSPFLVRYPGAQARWELALARYLTRVAQVRGKLEALHRNDRLHRVALRHLLRVVRGLHVQCMQKPARLVGRPVAVHVRGDEMPREPHRPSAPAVRPLSSGCALALSSSDRQGGSPTSPLQCQWYWIKDEIFEIFGIFGRECGSVVKRSWGVPQMHRILVPSNG